MFVELKFIYFKFPELKTAICLPLPLTEKTVLS